MSRGYICTRYAGLVDELQEDQMAEAQGAKVSDNKAPQVGRGEQTKRLCNRCVYARQIISFLWCLERQAITVLILLKEIKKAPKV